MVLTLPVRQSRTTFSKVEMPYSLKLLEQELTRGSYQLRFLTSKDARAFHEEEAAKRDPPAQVDLGTAAAAAAASTAEGKPAKKAKAEKAPKAEKAEGEAPKKKAAPKKDKKSEE
jgi:hypothetical protein